MSSAASSASPASLLRDRIVVIAAAVVWIVGTLIGMGVIGGRGVAEQGEGLFSDSATLIAPHGPAFTIWPVIYVFLALYIVWQWLPLSDASRWAARTRLPAAASLALNGVWLLTVFAGWIFVLVLVMLGIVVALGLVLREVAPLPAEGPLASAAVGVTFGLYLGWICVATCANIASWLVGLGVGPDGILATVLTVVVLVVVVALAAFLLRVARHRVVQAAFAAAVVWGTAWVAVGRLTGDLLNAPVAYAAGAAALGVAALGALSVVRNRVS